MFVVLTISAAAQGIVRGKVIDKQSDEVMQFVNVAVQTSAGRVIKGAITDSRGQFRIEGLQDGNYQLQISFVGYKQVTRRFSISAQQRHVSYNAIYLSEDARQLREVQVTGQRSQMKLEVDRKTFTVDQVLAAAGGVATDLLENIPSIEVTTDGEISLRGNSSVEVWINGKASGLTSDNRYEILQQIPAESIEKIEVIDNPSAKYSPEGSAGIINIVLKRDRRAGYYGSLQSGVNNHKGWNVGGNINYSSGPLDAYANIGYRRRRGSGGNEAQQTLKQTLTYENSESQRANRGGGLFARMGLTWHPTKHDDITLGGMTLQGGNDDKNEALYHYGLLASTDNRQMYRLTTGDGNMHMYHAELGYEHRFSDNHKLTAHVEYNRWMSDNDNYYLDYNVLLPPYPAVMTTGAAYFGYQYRPMNIRNRSWEAKLDYENQLSEKTKLEAGYDGRFSHENTPQRSWSGDNWFGENTSEDFNFYNRFIYSIDVHAAYATLNTRLGKLGVMAGLRGEYWRVNTESYDFWQEADPTLRDKPYDKDFFQLFPSLFLNYDLSKTAQLQLNYTRRLRRPWGGQLNSFRNTRDASIVEFGNPELTPEYTNSFSLNFLKTWTDHTLSLSTYYRPSTDIIQRIRYRDQTDGLMYMTNMNVAKSQSAGVELIMKDRLWRILDLTTTLNGYYYKLDDYNFIIANQVVSGQGDKSFSWNGRLLASLILPYDISLQATGNYRSRAVITQGYRKPNASLDLGLRKTFFNKRLAVAFNWRDVFASRHWENYTESDSFWRHQKNWRDPRVNLQLTWNFGNMNQRKRPARDGEQPSADDDQQNFGGYEQ